MRLLRSDRTAAPYSPNLAIGATNEKVTQSDFSAAVRAGGGPKGCQPPVHPEEGSHEGKTAPPGTALGPAGGLPSARKSPGTQPCRFVPLPQNYYCANDLLLRPLNRRARSEMEYRGKQYTVVQGIGRDSWRWTVHLDEKTIKSGQATSRTAAMNSVVWLIDKALEPKKVNPDPPSGELF